MRLLDGTGIAASIRESLRPGVADFTARTGRQPGLDIVLVGDNPGSEIYVRNKLKAGADIGFRVELHRLPATTTVAVTVALVEQLNGQAATDAILVQAPLPAALGPDAAQRVFDAIDPAKDVDGFNPVNVGKLVQRRTTLAPCTPLGIVELLDRSGIAIAGARAVIVGRSDIVGKPLAMLLLHRDATVTICHSKTPDLAAVARAADILVAAIGRCGFVTREHVKPGATVIDVGINRLTDPVAVDRLFPEGSPRRAEFDRRGSIVVGDVHPNVQEVAGALTPVPGGVGPLTIALLLSNTLRAAERRTTRTE